MNFPSLFCLGPHTSLASCSASILHDSLQSVCWHCGSVPHRHHAFIMSFKWQRLAYFLQDFQLSPRFSPPLPKSKLPPATWATAGDSDSSFICEIRFNPSVKFLHCFKHKVMTSCSVVCISNSFYHFCSCWICFLAAATVASLAPTNAAATGVQSNPSNWLTVAQFLLLIFSW